MQSMDTVTFNDCDEIKSLEANVHIENEGQLLRVPVYLHNVCPCRQLIVGVCVYVNNRLYAMKTKKVFTGGRHYCPKICEFYAGDFLFLFDDCFDKQIRTRILSHYIY